MLRSSHLNHARFISFHSSKFPFLNRRPSSRRLKPRNSDQWAGVIAPKAALIEATNDLFPLRSDAIEFERTCSLIDSFAKQTYQTVGELLSQDYLLLSPRSVLPHAGNIDQVRDRFLRTVTDVALRAKYRPLSYEEAKFVESAHLQQSLPLRIDWSSADPVLMDVLHEAPYKSAASDETYAVAPPPFANRVLVLHRGKGVEARTGYYYSDKVDEVIERGYQGLLRSIRRGRFKIARAYRTRKRKAREWSLRVLRPAEELTSRATAVIGPWIRPRAPRALPRANDTQEPPPSASDTPLYDSPRSCSVHDAQFNLSAPHEPPLHLPSVIGHVDRRDAEVAAMAQQRLSLSDLKITLKTFLGRVTMTEPTFQDVLILHTRTVEMGAYARVRRQTALWLTLFRTWFDELRISVWHNIARVHFCMAHGAALMRREISAPSSSAFELGAAQRGAKRGSTSRQQTRRDDGSEQAFAKKYPLVSRIEFLKLLEEPWYPVQWQHMLTFWELSSLAVPIPSASSRPIRKLIPKSMLHLFQPTRAPSIDHVEDEPSAEAKPTATVTHSIAEEGRAYDGNWLASHPVLHAYNVSTSTEEGSSANTYRHLQQLAEAQIAAATSSGKSEARQELYKLEERYRKQQARAEIHLKSFVGVALCDLTLSFPGVTIAMKLLDQTRLLVLGSAGLGIANELYKANAPGIDLSTGTLVAFGSLLLVALRVFFRYQIAKLYLEHRAVQQVTEKASAQQEAVIGLLTNNAADFESKESVLVYAALCEALQDPHRKERTLEEITDFVEDVLTGIRTAERIGFRYMTRADHLYPGATPATDEEEDDFIFGDGSDEYSDRCWFDCRFAIANLLRLGVIQRGSEPSSFVALHPREARATLEQRWPQVLEHHSKMYRSEIAGMHDALIH